MDINKITIRLDSSVRHITKTACMALSGNLVNGLLLVGKDSTTITIYKDKIDFGKTEDPCLQSVFGHIYTNFYKEYDHIVYRFGSNFKCSLFTKTIDYVGILAPTVPDDPVLFNLIYPKFS